MEPPLPSSSASLTSRSTQSMEIDSILSARNTPTRTTSGSARNTPLQEAQTLPNSAGMMGIEIEKGIVVEPRAMDAAVVESPPIDMENSVVAEVDDEDVVTPFQKRKRPSINYNLDVLHNKVIGASPSDEPAAKRTKPSQKIRGVVIGVWRDSDLPDDKDKHVIFGFIDIHDRLRTRIYPMNRDGQELIANIPTGAGGCWVTFPRIIFDAHLRSLSSLEIKEYVKIRSGAKPESTAEERHEADMKAVLKAMSIVASQENTSPGGTRPAGTAHRQSLGSASINRQSLPRQSLTHTPSFKAVNASNASQIQTPKTSPFNESKPNGVLLGYWADSDEPLLEDKHAVYGVIGNSDCFRVKVQRITRDGRYVDGNFPIGAGALWLHYDKLVLEAHLSGMTRPEVKEYVRIRQRELENKESEKDRKANELKAVRDAKAIAASHGLNNGVEQDQANPEIEVRHSARSELKVAARQQAEAQAAADRIRKEKVEARERQNEKTRKEVAAVEAVIKEAAQVELNNNLKKLNRVWVAQQAATAPKPVGDEVKYHNGVKYERKQSGPFEGKLVSSPQILSIDGEDYVEYRVLTKPSFF